MPLDHSGIEFNSLPWTIQAACAGQGIALGWKYLCDDLVASGTLVRPIPQSLRTKRGYYMLLPRDTTESGYFDEIYDWIRERSRD